MFENAQRWREISKISCSSQPPIRDWVGDLTTPKSKFEDFLLISASNP